MGKKKSSTQTTKSSSSSSSWLYDNKDMQSILNNVISNSANMPDYQYAGLNDTQKNALQALIGGRDQSQLEDNANWMNDASMNAYSQGTSSLGNATSVMQRYANMTQDDYQGMIQGAMNSNLVSQQKDIAARDIQKSLDRNVQSLNQNATMTGNMGSSRAGVAQGVMTGEALKTLSDTNTAIDQNAYVNAINSVNNQISSSMSGASSLGQYGQYGMSTGLSGVNTANNWLNQINQNNISDLNNAFNAGSVYQQDAQNQANTAWYNQINKDNPYLGQFQLLYNTLGGTAGWSTKGTGTQTATVSGGSSGWGGALGGLAGAGIGAYLGGSQGAGIGSSVGGGFGSLFG